MGNSNQNLTESEKKRIREEYERFERELFEGDIFDEKPRTADKSAARTDEKPKETAAEVPEYEEYFDGTSEISPELIEDEEYPEEEYDEDFVDGESFDETDTLPITDKTLELIRERTEEDWPEYDPDDENYYYEDEFDPEEYDPEDELYDEEAYSGPDDREDFEFSRARQRRAAREYERDTEGLSGWLESLSVMDVAIAAAAILILVLGGIFGSRMLTSRQIEEKRSDIAALAEHYEGLSVIGGDTLQVLAASRQQEEELRALALEEEQRRLEAEAAAVASIPVEVRLSTIQSDIKIKFLNKDKNALIADAPFRVEVTTPSGGTQTWEDDDRDGIIYKNGLANGTYRLTAQEFTDKELMKYGMPKDAQTISVTDAIAYQKVDVSDEIKKESEINVAQEDTAKKDTVVESVITDTVEWVESTKTQVGEDEDGFVVSGEGWQTVGKDEINDPYATASAGRMRGIKLMSVRYHKLMEPDEGGENSDQQETPDEASQKDSSQDGASQEDGQEGASQEDGQEGASQQDGRTENHDQTTQEDQDDQKQDETQKDPDSVAVVGVSLDKTSASGAKGSTLQLTASVEPHDAANRKVSWSSENDSIAAVDSAGKVTLKEAGTTRITVKTEDCGMTASCEVTVTEETASSSVDEDAALKDKNGNQLYVKDGDSYREAKVRDYRSFDTFYRKAAGTVKYRYTGWQNIEGRIYFFDKNGNYVTGTQIIQGATYEFGDDGAMKTGDTMVGIDVSTWNASIDWNAVRASGISFAIIRCGYRGSTIGALVEDSRFRANIQGAKNAGLKVGVYFFSQAVTEAEAVEEASMALQLVSGYGLNLPIFLDVESSGGRGDLISAEQRTQNIRAFCQTIRNSGYSAGIYANTNWYTEKINTPSLTDYHIWLAQYAAAPTYSRTRYDLWQYSAKGRVSGISGDVDMNISYRQY